MSIAQYDEARAISIHIPFTYPSWHVNILITARPIAPHDTPCRIQMWQ